MNFLHAQFPDDKADKKEEDLSEEALAELGDESDDDEDEETADFDLHDDRDDY